MTQKKIRKLADEIVKLELIHRNPKTSKDEVNRTEKRIIQLTNMINALPDGMNIMLQIDDMIYEKLQKITQD